MSRKPIVIGTSPLTGTIYAGTLLKDQQTWSTNRNVVTDMACGAVAEHVIKRGGTITVTANGKPQFEITVRDLSEAGHGAGGAAVSNWQAMETAPKDGTRITLRGHIDTHTRKKGTYHGCSFNVEYGLFMTRGGWFIFPDKWTPDQEAPR